MLNLKTRFSQPNQSILHTCIFYRLPLLACHFAILMPNGLLSSLPNLYQGLVSADGTQARAIGAAKVPLEKKQVFVACNKLAPIFFEFGSEEGRCRMEAS
jgi:hypothetical protein